MHGRKPENSTAHKQRHAPPLQLVAPHLSLSVSCTIICAFDMYNKHSCIYVRFKTGARFSFVYCANIIEKNYFICIITMMRIIKTLNHVFLVTYALARFSMKNTKFVNRIDNWVGLPAKKIYSKGLKIQNIHIPERRAIEKALAWKKVVTAHVTRQSSRFPSRATRDLRVYVRKRRREK